MEQKNGAATASTILGIVSLVIAVIGGITFGVIGAAIALILGIMQKNRQEAQKVRLVLSVV